MAPNIGNQDVRYRPDTGNWFDLPSAWIPESRLNVAEAIRLIPPELRDELIQVRDGVRYFRLYIHPESRKFYKEFVGDAPITADYEATATASSRTLLVRSKADPSKLFFAKVSLDVELGGVRRTILRDESARGIGTTMYLERSGRDLSDGFEFAREPLGIIPKGWDEGGQIIRLIPPEVLSGKSTLIPLFSLYAKKEDGSLIEKLAKKTGLAPREFAEKFVVEPFARSWAEWAVHGPVVMEAHAQNVLLELDASGMPTRRFFLRDLGGFEIDDGAPGFVAARLEGTPVFKTRKADYYPKTAEQMQTQSLSTYFEGGFLFNVDKELKRVQPGYKEGEINETFWSAIGAQLSRVSGVPVALFSRAQLEKRMPLMVKLAEFGAARPGAKLESVIDEAIASNDVVRKQGEAWLKESIKAPAKGMPLKERLRAMLSALPGRCLRAKLAGAPR
jgi:hypothetical protein